MKIFDNLTFEEKLRLLRGKNTWQTDDLDGKLPSLILSDGPHGLRKTLPLTPGVVFPTLSTLGNTWNKELAYLQGHAIASTCVEHGTSILLAPGVNIKRSSFCGRNFEYFSEDPYLSGTLGFYYIKGVQDLGIGACLKHWCCNNYEYKRDIRSSEVDEQTLFEIYLKPFEIALKANPWTLMPSYNRINGTYSCENEYLLKDVLRNKYQYDGYIISDWRAIHDFPKALKAGTDLRMPFDEHAIEELKQGYKEHRIDDNDINSALVRYENLLNKINNKNKKVIYSRIEQHLNALKIAQEGIVLLENKDNILPLAKNKKVVIYGKSSINPPFGGGGSSWVTPDYVSISIETLLKKEGYDASYGGDFSSFYLDDSPYAIVALGVEKEMFSEGKDRSTLHFDKNEEDFVLDICKKKKTIVVIYCGGVIDVTSFKDAASGIILAGYSGEGVNEALADIISGKVNPSGKLNETFFSLPDHDFVDGVNSTEEVEKYVEGLFVGYRRMGKPNFKCIYPFGYGLSYSKFVYSDLKIVQKNKNYIEVTFDIQNNSYFDGKEICQLYIANHQYANSRPIRELKKFDKVYIRKGETEKITFILSSEDFAIYSISHHNWITKNATYDIEIGSSSADILLKKEICLNN